jgi:diguanylate cyclase (GGDEF)-like protein
MEGVGSESRRPRTGFSLFLRFFDALGLSRLLRLASHAWMMAPPLKVLAQTIKRHPWSSLQDGLLIAMAMVVGLLLALEYDLFSFIGELSEPQRKISLAEAIFLTVLLALLIVTFVIRRLHEERRDVARQISTKKQLGQLRKQASRDSLTDLANRDAILSALEAITSPSFLGRKHAFFLLDLNDFKRVNDLHGHVLGDRVLQVIAQRFRGVTRPSDILARLGGDEFALLCYDVDRKTADAIAHRFIASLENEISVAGQSYQIGASIGAVLIPDDGSTAEEIIHHADLAMYRAKGLDCSSAVFFEQTENSQRRIATQN